MSKRNEPEEVIEDQATEIEDVEPEPEIVEPEPLPENTTQRPVIKDGETVIETTTFEG